MKSMNRPTCLNPSALLAGEGRRRSPVSEELRLRWGRTVNVAEILPHQADTVVKGVGIGLPSIFQKTP
jgi:hypothetical protein